MVSVFLKLPSRLVEGWKCWFGRFVVVACGDESLRLWLKRLFFRLQFHFASYFFETEKLRLFCPFIFFVWWEGQTRKSLKEIAESLKWGRNFLFNKTAIAFCSLFCILWKIPYADIKSIQLDCSFVMCKFSENYTEHKNQIRVPTHSYLSFVLKTFQTRILN